MIHDSPQTSKRRGSTDLKFNYKLCKYKNSHLDFCCILRMALPSIGTDQLDFDFIALGVSCIRWRVSPVWKRGFDHHLMRR
jgi:hypothetical protein